MHAAGAGLAATKASPSAISRPPWSAAGVRPWGGAVPPRNRGLLQWATGSGQAHGTQALSNTFAALQDGWRRRTLDKRSWAGASERAPGRDQRETRLSGETFCEICIDFGS